MSSVEIWEAAESLPPPSAETVLIRVAIEAYLETAHLKPRERAAAFVRVASAILATEESVSVIMPFRAASKQAEVARARRGAVALFRLMLPVFLARVRPR